MMMIMNRSLLLLPVAVVVAFLLASSSVVEAFTTTTTTTPTVSIPALAPSVVSSSSLLASSRSSSKLFSTPEEDDDDEVPFALRDTPSTTRSTSSSSSSGTGFDPSDIMSKIQGAIPKDLDLPDLDMGAFGESLGALQRNLMDGPVGERGEIYSIAQVGVLLCILIGTVPVVGGLLMVLLGPGLLLAGLAVMVLSVQSMGSALSPWPTPPSDGKLITDGLYAEVRHPMYAGLLAACTGYSIVTDSASRLLLTAVLLYVLDVKTDKEEDAMKQMYGGEYDSYSSQVTNKFFPQSVLDNLPW